MIGTIHRTRATAALISVLIWAACVLGVFGLLAWLGF